MATEFKVLCINTSAGNTEIEEILLADVPKSAIFIHYTTAERDALSPTESDMIYNTTAKEYQYYDGTTWNSMRGA